MPAWRNEKRNQCAGKQRGLALRLTALVMAVLAMASFMTTASAAGSIDTQRECSLELCYRLEDKTFGGRSVKLYRAAEVSADGTYTLTGAFAEYPVKVNDISVSSEWKDAAAALAAYAAADEISPEQLAKTDAEGMVCFSALSTGLYLVISEDVVIDDCIFTVSPFLISLPNLNPDGDWVFDVSANPKTEIYHPLPDEVEHKVTKVWNDAGYEKDRPEKVVVDILKDGKKVSQQVLSRKNNWAYSWSAPDDGSVWQVVEREVPQGYTVRVRAAGAAITITNTKTTKPPYTGDRSNPSLYFMLMIASGVLLLVLGKKKPKEDQTV